MVEETDPSLIPEDTSRRWPLWLGATAALTTGVAVVVGVFVLVLTIGGLSATLAGAPEVDRQEVEVLPPAPTDAQEPRLPEPVQQDADRTDDSPPTPIAPSPPAPRRVAPTAVAPRPVAPARSEPTPEPEPPIPDPVPLGMLRINSLPAFRVQVDGVDVGVAPVSLRRDPGSYTVVIQGEPPMAREVVVTEQRPGSWCWDFTVDGPC